MVPLSALHGLLSTALASVVGLSPPVGAAVSSSPVATIPTKGAIRLGYEVIWFPWRTLKLPI